MRVATAEADFRIFNDPNDRQVLRPITLARGTVPPAAVEEVRVVVETSALAPDVEQRVIAILRADREGGETIELTYKRKENELASVFAGLTQARARALHARLLAAHQDDALASSFARLVEARRIRLMAFLLTARR
jgi:hypothetical protein